MDDVFVAFKDVTPHLTRASLHHRLQRRGISRLPQADRQKPILFRAYELGFCHIDIEEPRYEGGEAYLFIAAEGTSTLVFAKIYTRATKLVTAGFLHALLRAPTRSIKIHAGRTDGGHVAQFSGRVCPENDVERRLTKPYHPWTYRRAEGMVRLARTRPSVLPFRFEVLLRRHRRDWLLARNYAR